MSVVKRYVPTSLKRIARRIVGPRHERPRAAPAPTQGMLSFHGLCSICGHHDLFDAAAEAQFAARSFPCRNCAATVRFRNEASTIIDEFGRGRHVSLSTLVDDPTFASVSIYNTGVAGPVRLALSGMANYVESRYWDGGVPGVERDGVQHQDLHALTFEDDSFDLVTSSHVLEHVADPAQAFRELLRVLRPGGRLIFSVPVPWPPPATSTQRARVVDGAVEHIEPAVHHDSPGGAPSLVFTDFGSDLLDLLEGQGFIATQRRPQMAVELAFRDSVFVASKPAGR